MGRRLVPRFLPTMEVSTMADSELHDLVAAIGDAAPTCLIVKANPALQASVTALAVRGASLTASTAVVTADRAKLNKDLGTQAEDRTALQGELRTYMANFVAKAKSPADLLSGGLTPAPPRPPKNQVPEVPEHIDQRPSKTGKPLVYVSVHEAPSARKEKYVAEQSPDGSSAYTPLGAGFGKSRTVSGVTGAKIWVRFAMVRGNLQSDWSAPILVTIP